MPRKNANLTNYHYRVDTCNDNNEIIKSKYYFTLKEICDEYKISSFTVYRIMNKDGYKARGIDNLIKIYKDYKPVYEKVKNEREVVNT
jgi:predicted DNA-binding protein YlxM (UPF0122 family)